MSTHPDHEAFLRAALHAAADSLEPRANGLERIRTRLRQRRPVPIALALAFWTEAFQRAPAWLQDTVYRTAAGCKVAWERFGPPQTPGRHRSRAQGWLRPLAAMGVVMFIVAAGVYAAIDAGTAIFPSSSNSHSTGGTGSNGHPGAPVPGVSQSSRPPSTQKSGSRSPAPTCTTAGPSPSTSATNSTALANQSTSSSPASSGTSGSAASASPSPTGAGAPPAPAANAGTSPTSPPYLPTTQAVVSPSVGATPTPTACASDE